jgi:hypothetical protein
MASLKASKSQILNSFPTKQFGQDGDIIFSRINGRGVFLCSKVGGIWYAANQMQELNRLGKAKINDLTVDKLTITNTINSENSLDKYIVSDSGNLKHMTAKQVVDDLPLPFNNISYKTAYCSLEQYSDKETCELNGGTWYYSENDSHDSVSSTAENQLLTVGQSIGSVDAESKLLYDGSTLEIKYNSDYDDNWQTSAQTDLLKLSYDSSKNAVFNISDSGRLTIDCTNDIILDADGGQVYVKDNDVNHFTFDCDNTQITIWDDTDLSDYLRLTVGANGASTISTNDNDGTAGNLTLDADGDIELNADGGDITFKDDSASLATINGDGLTINNIGSDSAGDNYLVEVSGLVKKRTPAEVLSDIGAQASGSYITGSGSLSAQDLTDIGNLSGTNTGDQTLPTNYVTNDASDTMSGTLTLSGGHLKVDSSQKIVLDGNAVSNDTYISESSADTLDVVVGGDIALRIIENSNECTSLFRSSAAGFTQSTTTYNATDTDVNFRVTNKSIVTFGAGNITDVQLYFPSGSGNFVLLLKQDGTGSREVTNWKAYDTEGNAAAGSSTVIWAGGSAPTLTTDANHVDILSFYWDDTNEIAYGVATLDFQF